MQIATLTETAKRRPSFEPGVPVLLEDGQQWQLPRPRIRWKMVVRDDVKIVEGHTHFGPAFDALRERINASENDADYLGASFDSAAWLLRRNYELTEDEALSLLAYDGEDEANQAVWATIYDVIWGRAPKHSAGGAV
jgi:hypothetical protein